MKHAHFAWRGTSLEVRLADWEQQFLSEMVSELRANLLNRTPASDGRDRLDPTLARLFPPAYLEDAEHEAEYQRLMRDDLLAERLEQLDALDATLGAARLDADAATSWLRGLNALRLALGTRIDVSEEADMEDVDPHDPAHAPLLRYHYLGGLLAELVDALA